MSMNKSLKNPFEFKDIVNYSNNFTCKYTFI